tara:strand:+ start:2562 stop:3542 length:981 start_codon:yes stop_codon:yes gene_type:complete
MSQTANTFDTFAAKGIRESLSNVIYNISPEETPFMSNIGRENVKNTYFEWQTDSLAAASTTNAQVEGDDVSSFDSTSATTRVGNYTQISNKTVLISGTLEAVDKAGRRSELAYQLAKRSAEIKRDMESTMLTNQAASAGSAGVSTALRKTGSLLAFLKTNTDKGTGGADPVYTSSPNATRTDATAANLRTFTEAILKTVIQKVWASGGSPKLLMVGPVNKARVSGFAGIAEIRREVTGNRQATIIGAADVYVSDFGSVSVVPNRFQRERDAFVLDPEYASVAFLRPFQTVELAKTGDAEKRLITVEYGLKVNTEAAHGLAADLTTT